MSARNHIFLNDISIPQGKREHWVNVYQDERGVWYGLPRDSRESAQRAASDHECRGGDLPVYRIRVTGKPRPKVAKKTRVGKATVFA